MVTGEKFWSGGGVFQGEEFPDTGNWLRSRLYYRIKFEAPVVSSCYPSAIVYVSRRLQTGVKCPLSAPPFHCYGCRLKWNSRAGQLLAKDIWRLVLFHGCLRLGALAWWFWNALSCMLCEKRTRYVCIVLCCIALLCFALHCTALYCIITDKIAKRHRPTKDYRSDEVARWSTYRPDV